MGHLLIQLYHGFGISYTLANPTRTGYTFSSWTKSGAGTLSVQPLQLELAIVR